MSRDVPLTLDDFARVPLDDWRQRAGEQLRGKGIDGVGRRVAEGVDLRILYTEEDLPDRAPDLSTARSRGRWSICSAIDAGAPRQISKAVDEALGGGADAIWLRFDRAARLALEVDHPEAAGHLGAGGVLVHHDEDLRAALGDGSLERLASGGALWLDAGGNALPATALVLAELEARGVGEPVLHCGADPLGALARDGRLPRDLMKLESEMAVLARYSRDRLHGGRALTVSTVPYHERGCGVVAELAFAAATLTAYLRALERSGLAAGDVAAEIALRFAVGSNLFVEMAKLRAARLLWQMVLLSCGLEEVPPALVHATGSWCTLTRRGPWNNLLRSTGQTFAAVGGGADVMSLFGFDRALGPSDAPGRRLTRTTQLILAEEAHLARVEDPAAGSYYIESLTRRLVESAWSEMQEIERRGGMTHCLRAGWVGSRIERDAKHRAGLIASGDAVIVGVTAHAEEAEEPLRRRPEDRDLVRRDAVQRLAAQRRARSGSGPDKEIAYGRHFVVDELLAAARGGETLAEISRRLGSDDSAETIEVTSAQRDAAPYEREFGVDV